MKYFPSFLSRLLSGHATGLAPSQVATLSRQFGATEILRPNRLRYLLGLAPQPWAVGPYLLAIEIAA